MRRGDVVTSAAAGDYGKQRPAVIVQTAALRVEPASVVACRRRSYGRDSRVNPDPV